ncbi:hypothetical protein NC652_030881 [Populus alba x Populus x berolinensis]|uniref:Uncharacterized protein n=1 Tax=Populus alba x Populus x berolinensis TaxID=444605 RepID=A0AAD6LX67_9ROSI|nr:hypothetical protein NC651_029952 [Populus alba x Populus x berolinensis]KAJ6883771.1 hypothetical protein NC652_030881 [Populus alba x Populus x berolinensis]KAJ6974680.1 hypothetical protein NC653_030718 [Populus alba x Populus x berolinensis]
MGSGRSGRAGHHSSSFLKNPNISY